MLTLKARNHSRKTNQSILYNKRRCRQTSHTKCHALFSQEKRILSVIIFLSALRFNIFGLQHRNFGNVQTAGPDQPVHQHSMNGTCFVLFLIGRIYMGIVGPIETTQSAVDLLYLYRPLELQFYRPVNIDQVMSSWSVNLLTLFFQSRLSPLSG